MIYIMNTYGYLGVCFLIAVENLFPPIPSEVILTFGGFMTTYTRLTVPGVVIFSTLGSTIGALILYRVGMALTPEKLESLTKGKLFHLLGFEKEDVEETIDWFEKHGKKAILLGRCIPIIRSLVKIPAFCRFHPLQRFQLPVHHPALSGICSGRLFCLSAQYVKPQKTSRLPLVLPVVL